ncbi:DNase I-like protein [Violaceomyces palustris]|uniref:DNase I-like protein n=1 Tax=Violaceomyces palustris TaxID=1673888 RepID=A0ACD0NQ71_9BASI|nr:DNase I-like protein [Violaceomyces palustris]
MTMTTQSNPSPSRELKVLTLNVWGLKYISKLREERLRSICSLLTSTNSSYRDRYDLICLQEIWYESKDFKYLRNSLSDLYPHSKFFLSGAFGSGLAILSKWEILEFRTNPYSLNGHPLHVHKGDWFVGKACGSVTVHHPWLGLVDVWNTHLVGVGGETGPESKRCHRVTQAYELSKRCNESAERGRHVICAGDLNSIPPSLSIAILKDLSRMTDSFLESHPNLPAHATRLPLNASAPFPSSSSSNTNRRSASERSISELGVTCDSPLNTWSEGKKLDQTARNGLGKRLDYILFRGPRRRAARRRGGQELEEDEEEEEEDDDDDDERGRLRVKESKVVLTERIPNLNVSYSDHFGLETVFEILPLKRGGGDVVRRGSREAKALQDHAVGGVNQSKVTQTLTSSLQALSGGLIQSRRDQRAHFLAFSSCLAAILAILVVSAVVQGGRRDILRPFLVLLTLLFTWAATTLFYSAVVWSEWEKRTLRTMMESMESDLKRSRSNSGTLNSNPYNLPESTEEARRIQGEANRRSSGSDERLIAV